ncbi:MAG: hypothetical protein FWC43_10630 [Planctomycetaceae bacterium]|nr:hypothetical protein [Planctomycetaceae bacterium]
MEQTFTLRFVDGLLQRGLYESALRFCETELQKTKGTVEQADFFASEKVRVLTQFAISLPAAEREPILHKIEQWERQWKTQENSFQFPYQLALSDLKLGELYRLEETAAAAQNSPVTEKRSIFFLNRARERLEELRKTAAGKIEDRTALLDFQTAMVRRSLALGFERTSGERIDALQRAIQGLTPLAVLNGTDPIIVQSRLEKAACHRLLHELDAAGETLDLLLQQKETLSESERVQAAAEGIRLFLAQGKIDQAIQWSAIEPPIPHPDYDLARLETYLSQWKLVSRTDEMQGAPLLNRVLEFSKRMEQLHGPYWSRRAQMLVAECTKSETTRDFGVYLQLAEDAYHRERFDDAIRYYDLASVAAEQSNDAPSAFQFALAAASVEIRLEHDQAAQKRFRDAAKKWSDREQADAAYLFGLEMLQKSVAGKDAPVADLIDGLVEFTKTWPTSPQQGEIARKAAQLLEKEGRFQEAFEICPEFEGRIKTIGDIQTLTAQGYGDEARQKAAQLWKKNPQDAEIVQLYGDLLASSDPKDALEFWRDVEKRFENVGRPKTEAEDTLYWKAKESIIWLHFQLGNREQAKKLLDLVRLLHPEQSERFKDIKL